MFTSCDDENYGDSQSFTDAQLVNTNKTIRPEKGPSVSPKTITTALMSFKESQMTRFCLLTNKSMTNKSSKSNKNNLCF